MVDPDLFPELAANQTKTLDAVEALQTIVSPMLSFFVFALWPENAYHGIESAVAQHLENLSVLLAFLLEGEFALLIAVNPVSVTARR